MTRSLNFDDERAIKRLLRRQNTPEYFKGDGWTADPEEAKCFTDVLEAAETCARLGLSDVELTLRAGSRASDIFCTPIR